MLLLRAAVYGCTGGVLLKNTWLGGVEDGSSSHTLLGQLCALAVSTHMRPLFLNGTKLPFSSLEGHLILIHAKDETG